MPASRSHSSSSSESAGRSSMYIQSGSSEGGSTGCGELPRLLTQAPEGANHMSTYVAYQFDLELPHVMDLLHHMLDRYDTVSCYSSNLIEEGVLIYCLEPFMVGPNQTVEGSVRVGCGKFDAKAKAKGRFGIVTRKHEQHIKVANIYTFGDRGLEYKPRRIWKEYAELSAERISNDEPYEDGEIMEENDLADADRVVRSPYRSLSVAESFTKAFDKSVVHLMSYPISLTSQILVAGSITPGSLARLRTLIAQMDA
ncbi:hypothetical protein BU23DRAFT_596796 [Bimuria novae-zelandiae CBS 107.79]|uniref:Uncharacterized protein n=1 Tax=Bimuria novae-zelandiae CBS 107.79 TaxID=1447943 RepID=A0A6A5VIM7_9PLEO|nr:hypothetical protein BU23DRAFT_596796 [Bimuria novae-zelandiae CBS 107.79]